MKNQARILRSDAPAAAIPATRRTSPSGAGPDLLGTAISIGVPLIALAILSLLANDRLADMETRLSSRIRDAEYRIEDLRRENVRLQKGLDQRLEQLGGRMESLAATATGVDSRLAGVEERLKRQRSTADSRPTAAAQ
jgi:FtsZ-binding cell division protein ZapB